MICKDVSTSKKLRVIPPKQTKQVKIKLALVSVAKTFVICFGSCIRIRYFNRGATFGGPSVLLRWKEHGSLLV